MHRPWPSSLSDPDGLAVGNAFRDRKPGLEVRLGGSDSVVGAVGFEVREACRELERRERWSRCVHTVVTKKVDSAHY